MELVILFWLFPVLFCPFLARAKHRTAFGWFVMAVIFGVLALIMLALLPKLDPSAGR